MNNQRKYSNHIFNSALSSRNPISNSILNKIQSAMVCHTCQLKKPHSFIILKCNHIVCQTCIQDSCNQSNVYTCFQQTQSNIGQRKTVKNKRYVKCSCGTVTHLDQSFLISQNGYLQESLQKYYFRQNMEVHQDTKCQTTTENIFAEEGSFQIENYIKRDYNNSNNSSKNQAANNRKQQSYRPRKTTQVVSNKQKTGSLQNYLLQDRRSTNKRSKNHSRGTSNNSQFIEIDLAASSRNQNIQLSKSKDSVSNQINIREQNLKSSQKKYKKVIGAIRSTQKQNLNKFKKTGVVMPKKSKPRPNKYYAIHTDQGQLISSQQQQKESNRSLQKLLKHQESEQDLSQVLQTEKMFKIHEKQQSRLNPKYDQENSLIIDIMGQQNQNMNPNTNERNRIIKQKNRAESRYSSSMIPNRVKQNQNTNKYVLQKKSTQNSKITSTNFANQIDKQLKLLKMQYKGSRKQLKNDFQRFLEHIDCQFNGIVQNLKQLAAQQAMINAWNNKLNVMAPAAKLSNELKKQYNTKIQDQIGYISEKLFLIITGNRTHKEGLKKEFRQIQRENHSKLNKLNETFNESCNNRRYFVGSSKENRLNNQYGQPYKQGMCKHHKEKVRHSYNRFMDELYKNNKVCKKGFNRRLKTIGTQLQ